MSNKIALYCRPGFEKECAAEITDKAGQKEIYGFARVKENSGYVIFECYQAEDADTLARTLPFRELIFARQMIVIGDLLKDLPPEDRITPIVNALSQQVVRAGDLRVEVADTNESKELLKFCRKFTVPLRNALRKEKSYYHLKILSDQLFMYSLLLQVAAIPGIHILIIVRISIWGSQG